MSTITTRAGKGSPLTNNEVDANFTNLNTDKAELSGAAFTGAITTTSTVDGRDVATDGTKLDGIEAGATADQTAAEIKTAYESNADTNAFTDADESKLDGIEASADVTDTANVTAAGALMDSELTAIASVKALNQGVATTDSPTFAAVTSTGEITANGGIALGDNDKATFGDGDDLQIYHDGSASYISDVGTGNLRIKSNGVATQILDGSSLNLAVFNSGNGQAQLYNVNSGTSTIRLATTSTGIDVTGRAVVDGLTSSASIVGTSNSNSLGGTTFTSSISTVGLSSTAAITSTSNSNSLGGTSFTSNIDVTGTASATNVSLPDDGVLSLGTSDELTLKHHNSGYSHLINTTGTLYIDSDSVTFRDDDGSPSNMVISQTGIDVTGTATMDGLTVDGNATFSGSVTTENHFAVIPPTTTNYAYMDYSNAGGSMYVGRERSSASGLLTGSTAYAGVINVIGAYPLEFGTNNSKRMTIDSSGRVGIGRTPSISNSKLEVGGADNVSLINVEASGVTGGMGIGSTGLQFFHGSSAKMHIDSSGNVGINQSNPTQKLHVSGNAIITGLTRIGDGTASSPSYQFVSDTDTGMYRASSNILGFSTGGAERMRISSGNLLVGKTSTSSGVVGHRFNPDGSQESTTNGGLVAYFNRKTSDGEIVRFDKDGAAVGSIGTLDGNSIYIGNGDVNLRMIDVTDDIRPVTSTGTNRDAAIDLGDANARFKDLYLSGNALATAFVSSVDTDTFINMTGSNIIKFYGGGAERMRIDSSGNVLVGKTSNAIAAAGAKLGTGGSNFTRSGNEVVYFNRTTNDGEIATFAKDGTTVGSIGSRGGQGIILNTGSYDGALAKQGTNLLYWGLNALYPTTDNSYDLGASSSRFDDIYATNGTIQTSDRNEKQDIAELSDAEQRVAVAAKGLLRKFRWKDSVAEKGDDARIHFGIIAQDLQAAFAAEGLDAGDYAMFISTTWTDEETNEEKTRMGVRYSELLAFIIAAI